MGLRKDQPRLPALLRRQPVDRSRFGVWEKNKSRRTFGPKHWAEPLKWNRQAEEEGRRHRVFCSSMTDWALDDPTIAADPRCGN